MTRTIRSPGALAQLAVIADGCPTCNATLSVVATRTMGAHLRCHGPAAHTFDVRTDAQRGSGHGTGIPVYRDEPSALSLVVE